MGALLGQLLLGLFNSPPITVHMCRVGIRWAPVLAFKEPGMRLRCSYKPYLDKVDAYTMMVPVLNPVIN